MPKPASQVLEQTTKLVQKKEVDQFLSKRKAFTDRSKDATGTLGKETDEFIKAHGLNKKGLSQFISWNNMSAQERADVQRTFDGLCATYEQEWGKQAELALDADNDDQDASDDPHEGEPEELQTAAE